MPRASDNSRFLSENVTCDLCGVSSARRRSWVSKGLLREPARFTELEVVELGVLKHLHDVLGPSDAAVIWREAREALRTNLLQPHLDLVVQARYREVQVVSDEDRLPALVRTGELVRVVPLAVIVARLRAAFRRLSEPDPKPARATARARRQRSAE